MKKLKFSSKKNVILFICVILILSFQACGSKEAVLMETEDLVYEEQETEPVSEEQDEKQMEQSNLFIHICGAVNSPGVYELRAGSRVFEAVEAAGGLCEDASDSSVNMALLLEDGWKIIIPSIHEMNQKAGNSNEEQTGGIFTDTIGLEEDNKLVNINTASKAELCSLPGIGESRAESIIIYREKNNGFSSIEDIMKVEGIKEGMFSKMKDKICVK